MSGQFTGTAYKALREEMGLSQPEAAKLVGVHPMTISKRERKGDRVIGKEAFLALEKALENAADGLS